MSVGRVQKPLWRPLKHLTHGALRQLLPVVDFTRCLDAEYGRPDASYRSSAVALVSVGVSSGVPVRDQRPCVLMIKRTMRGVHGGQIGFPGGMQDSGETLEETARRELFEELGISQKSFLNRMPEFATAASTTKCTPFIASRDDEPVVIDNLKVSVDEVDRVLAIPVHELLDEASFDPAGKIIINRATGMAWTGPVFKYQNYKIWGLSGRILVTFLDSIAMHVHSHGGIRSREGSSPLN